MDYVTRKEYEELLKEVNILKAQLNSTIALLNANSNLITPEQQKASYNAYMSQLQDEAIHENNERSFH